MNFLEVPGGIGRSISSRTAALAELARKLADGDARDAELKKHLVATAPASWKVFLDETLTIDHLFTYGKSNEKVYPGDNGYGFESGEDIAAKVEALNAAWNGTVKVTADDRGGRVEFWFIAVL